MFVLYSALFGFTLLHFSDASFVDELSKCSIKDDKCLQVIYQKMIQTYGKYGVPEFNLPPLEPMEIKNVSFPVLDAFYINVVSGAIRGISDCTYNSLRLVIQNEKKFMSADKLCDFILEGEMILSSKGPSPFGNSPFESSGHGKLNFDKMHFTYDKPIQFLRLEDGEIHWFWTTGDDAKYTLQVENVQFSGKNFSLENTDISQNIAEYFNSNWKPIMDSIGIPLLATCMKEYFALVNKLYHYVPTSAYILEDLSPYL